MNSFSSLLTFRAVGSISDSNGVSVEKAGVFEICGRTSGGTGPVGASVSSWTFAASLSVGTLGGAGVDAKQMLRLVAVATVVGAWQSVLPVGLQPLPDVL